MLWSLLSMVLSLAANGQSWAVQGGSGYGWANRIRPSLPIKAANLETPMVMLGVSRAFGDSSIHLRAGLEWEYQHWEQPFDTGPYPGDGLVPMQQRTGVASTRLHVVRVVPQAVFPMGRVAFCLGLDLGLVLLARVSETGSIRNGWEDHMGGGSMWGPWARSDSSWTGTTGLNLYQWSVRAGAELTVAKHWFVGLSVAMGNSTYVPPTGHGDGLTPTYVRCVAGRRFVRGR